MRSIYRGVAIAMLLVISFSLWSCKAHDVTRKEAPVTSHAIWNNLLQKHVNTDGWVNYQGFVEDSVQLKSYLGILQNNPPAKNWSENDKKAYWINAYNAFTVEIVRRNYPVESIRDIGPKKTIPFVNTVWDIKFIKIAGATFDLNMLEHQILRKKFDDPRIHFAINCASFSCPPLRTEAYTGPKVDAQLEDQARTFINDGFRNVIAKEKLQLSKIFKWFSGDFTKEKTLLEFIRPYAKTAFEEDPEIEYLEYQWNLNKQK